MGSKTELNFDLGGLRKKSTYYVVKIRAQKTLCKRNGDLLKSII